MVLMVNVAKILTDACDKQQKNVRQLTKEDWLEWTRANALKAAELMILVDWPADQILNAKALERLYKRVIDFRKEHFRGRISLIERYRLGWLVLWRKGCIAANRNTALVSGERYWKEQKSAKVPAKKRIPSKQADSNLASKGKGKTNGRKLRST